MTPGRQAYRADIDGLRALAVLSVLLYHYEVPGFSGGFTGVDVFFVISGYLITANILSDLEQSRFSFAAFYLRRIRRLLPALLATVAVTYAIAFIVFPPTLLANAAKSVVAAVFSYSNIYFYSQAGYFDADAQVKPLLHTWSLSVEEQFYLVCPALLYGLYRARRPLFLPLGFLGLGVLSVTASEWLLPRDPSAVFFLAPFRAGEFAIGAGIVWLERRVRFGARHGHPLALAGLALIVFSVTLFSHETRFPGFSALIPCAGAGLLIWAGPAGLPGLFLTWRPMVAVGLISYSLYLVHWPIFVFYRYYLPAPQAWHQAVLVAAALVCAWVLYTFVERPFRRRGAVSIPAAQEDRGFAARAAAFAAAVSLLGGLNGYVLAGKGWQSHSGRAALDARMEGYKRGRYALLGKICSKPSKEGCNPPSGHDDVLVMGDSHAPDALNAFFIARPGANYVLSALGGCPPLTPEDLPHLGASRGERGPCLSLNAQRLDPQFLKPFGTIVISTLFDWYKPEHLRHFLTRLRALSGARVIVVGPLISLNRECSIIAPAAGLPACFEQHNIKAIRPHEAELREITKEFGAEYVSKWDAFCTGPAVTDCQFIVKDVPVTADKHHLTLEAATFFGKSIRDKLYSGPQTNSDSRGHGGVEIPATVSKRIE